MVIQYIDGMPVRLNAPFDLDCLAGYGRVFRVFDNQDSGNLCFGVDDGTQKRFLKIAGAQTVRSDITNMTPEKAIIRMKSTVPVYKALAHPILCNMLDHKDIPGGFLTVYDWFDGLCMGRMYSTAAQFQALPLAGKLAIYDDILNFHIFVHQQGYIAVDFYDGCLLYEPETKALRICDIEFYRPGAFTNEMGRMWGSGRFMSPEEFTLGATIDERSNVFAMGATAFQLFGGGIERDISAWPLSRARYDIACKATENAPELRYPSIAALQAAWNAAE